MDVSSKIGLADRKRGVLRVLGSYWPATVFAVLIVVVPLLAPGEAPASGQLLRPLTARALNCDATKKITVKIVGKKRVATNYYFLVAFINNGDASCFLQGFPDAQPVIGVTPTAARSRQLNFAGIESAHVLVSAHGGRAYSVYRITSTGDFVESRCEPIIADGVAFAVGNRKLIAPIRRIGATTVCRSVSSTGIGLFSHLPYV